METLAILFLLLSAAMVIVGLRQNKTRTRPPQSHVHNDTTLAPPAPSRARDLPQPGIRTGATWATSYGRPDPAITAHVDRNVAMTEAKQDGQHDRALELARIDLDQAALVLGTFHAEALQRARRAGLPDPAPFPIEFPAVEILCQLGVARSERQLIADTQELMAALPAMDDHAAQLAQALADLDARSRIMALVAKQPGIPTAGLAAKIDHPHPRVRSVTIWLERDQQLVRHQDGSKYRLYLPGDAPAAPPPPPAAAAPDATPPPDLPAGTTAGIRFVAVDVETATPDRASICAIAACWVDDGQLVGTRRWLVQPPGNHYKPSNIRKHGIRPDHTIDAPQFDTIWDQLAPHLDGWPLVAHNAPFDRDCIVESLTAAGRTPPALNMGCTVAASRKVWPDLPNHKLPTVSAHVGQPVVRHHDPAADAEAAAHIAIAICAAAGIGDLQQL